MTDLNIDVDNTPQNILLGDSNSFIVQNLSNNIIRFKLKDSDSEGGIIPVYGTFSFAYDITVWSPTSSSLLYIIRD